jgi:tRNA isopentenyl-2-thiomethyl-A-37 hydroxylase MiaE
MLASMKPFRWNSEKNETLATERGISFERIVVSIESDGLLDILEHPNPARYPGQCILVVSCDGYAYLVPYLEEEAYYFLKTIIPSRKATREYLNKGETDAGQ